MIPSPLDSFANDRKIWPRLMKYHSTVWTTFDNAFVAQGILTLCDEFVPGDPPEYFFDKNPENFPAILELHRSMLLMQAQTPFHKQQVKINLIILGTATSTFPRTAVLLCWRKISSTGSSTSWSWRLAAPSNTFLRLRWALKREPWWRSYSFGSLFFFAVQHN